MKHRNRVIVNRPYKACVKPNQFGPSRHNGAFIAYKKIQAFRCFIYHLTDHTRAYSKKGCWYMFESVTDCLKFIG